jgi:hypothetical protein
MPANVRSSVSGSSICHGWTATPAISLAGRAPAAGASAARMASAKAIGSVRAATR